MANNNNSTQVVNRVVQPRLYQVFGDLIESKEIMEPIHILAGHGPICGFDWVDTTKPDLTIQSVFNAGIGNPDSNSNEYSKNEALISILKRKSKKVVLSTKSNNFGQVYNAYTTPDGLLFIAPGTLTFNGVQPDNGWPNQETPDHANIFCVIASHTYSPSDTEQSPSIDDFRASKLLTSVPIAKMLSWSLDDALNFLKTNDVDFNETIDVLIGIYIVGWDSSWDNDEDSKRIKPICANLLYKLCLNPYGGKLPVSPYMMSPLDIPDIKAMVLELKTAVNDKFVVVSNDIEENIKKINTEIVSIDRQLSSIKNSRGDGIEVEYTIQNEVDSDTYNFTKLIIQGCQLVAKGSLISKTLPYQAKEEAFGLIIYSTVPINGKDHIEGGQWGISVARITSAMRSVEKWDGSIDFSNLPSGTFPLALFDINFDKPGDDLLPNHAYTLINNTKIDGPTRLALSMPKALNTNSTTTEFTGSFSLKQPVTSGRTSYISIRFIVNKSSGILYIEITVMTAEGHSFGDTDIPFGSVLSQYINGHTEWKPIFEAFFKTYPGYHKWGIFGDITDHNHGYFWLNVNNPSSVSNIQNDTMVVRANGKGNDGDYSTTIPLVFPLLGLESDPKPSVDFVQIIANPFKQ